MTCSRDARRSGWTRCIGDKTIQTEDTSGDVDIIFLRAIREQLFVGVHDFEKEKRQAVEISVELEVDRSVRESGDFVSYGSIVEFMRGVRDSGEHIELVETLAEMILRHALSDRRVRRATVEVAKPDIYHHVQAVGVRISRSRAG